MKRNAVFPLAVILLTIALPVRSQAPDEKAAIRQAALDYIEGWYEADGARMDRALHKELAKRIIHAVGGTEQFTSLTKAQMVEATQRGGGKKRPADTRNIKVDILDVYRDIASVRTECADFIDYLQLAKSEGQWKIVNVLWQYNVKERKAVALEPKTLAAYAGEYELKPDFIITVTVEKDQLFLQATGQPRIQAFPSSETEFFLKDVEAQISFVKNDEGRITQLILHQGGNDAPARKIK
ncbi:MAG: nuclear transport factor 2 family protein [Acidobacteriia bacterium]|nr:nuclear transport factor 2 family protein [Terriglobia bacterium]